MRRKIRGTVSLGTLATLLADYGWLEIATLVVTLVVSYVIFGIAGFGSTLIAAPVLALKMPVASVVPLLALLDASAALLNGIKLNRDLDKTELGLLVPLMIIGSLVGITILISVKSIYMLVALGIFVILYGLYGLLSPPIAARLRRIWVLPFGLVGGVFSGMFGTGGFIYAMYLSRRLTEKSAMRATQTTLIGMSNITRVTVFAIAGVYADWHLVTLAAIGFPAVLLGLFLGNRITLRLPQKAFQHFLYVFLIATGSAVLWRAFAAG
jgi:uncharacterized membrane protein YfcA